MQYVPRDQAGLETSLRSTRADFVAQLKLKAPVSEAQTDRFEPVLPIDLGSHDTINMVSQFGTEGIRY